MVPVTDDNLIRFAIIRGSKAEIRLHFLQSGATSLDTVVKATRKAEAALLASRPSNDVAELKDQISELIEKIDAKPTIALMAPPKPRPTRRVSFSSSPARRDGERPESPSRFRKPTLMSRDAQSSTTASYTSPPRVQRNFSRPTTPRSWTPSSPMTRPSIRNV